jgi:hypothetical protein
MDCVVSPVEGPDHIKEESPIPPRRPFAELSREEKCIGFTTLAVVGILVTPVVIPCLLFEGVIYSVGYGRYWGPKDVVAKYREKKERKQLSKLLRKYDSTALEVPMDRDLSTVARDNVVDIQQDLK